ncbi:hypothetical protein [Methylocystis iwaonis]|uniref:hypothetical protein n=1 Tax=Methylocystis iwaonis TaxID=2885079 RepID=UPI002E7B7E9C|nr:hypothetical protein [Methylocystis iwaonis]
MSKKHKRTNKVVKSGQFSSAELTALSPGQKGVTVAKMPLLRDQQFGVSTPCGAEPIFVHSSFRASSTWLWNKLRSTPNTLAYYEIFHESLATMDLKQAATNSYSAWRSKHPCSAPYFLEYTPLLRATGGIPAYDASMAFSRFVPADGLDGHLSLEETIYVDGLLRNAHANQKIPVLTCTRTLGRVRALRKAYGGTVIFLHRNLFHQWASYSSLALAGNSYFMDTINSIVKSSRHDSFISWLDDWFSSRIASPENEQMFQVFLLLHLYLYAHAFDAADLVVDVTALAADKNARLSIEQALSNLVHSAVDLFDVRTDFEQSVFCVGRIPDFRDTIEQFTKVIVGTCLTDESVTFVCQMKDKALEEWDRHEFFIRGARSAHVTEIAELNIERDNFAAQLSEASASRDALHHSLAELASERDNLAAQLSEASASRDALHHSLAGLASERDNLAAQLSEASASRDALHRSLAELASERDSLAAQLSEASASRDALHHSLAELASERDNLVAQLSEASASRDALHHSLAGLASERDNLVAQLSEALAAQDADCRGGIA